MENSYTKAEMKEMNETIDRILSTIDNMNERLDGVIEILDSIKEITKEANKQAESILLYGPK
jgi:hypothetical protein